MSLLQAAKMACNVLEHEGFNPVDLRQSIAQAEQQPNTPLMEGYRIGLAEMREKCAKVCEQGTGEAVQKSVLEIIRQERERVAAAIRAIKFEGDTGFRSLPDHIVSTGKKAEQQPMKECRHCGFLCAPNPNESKKWYPLEQAEQPLSSFDKDSEPVAWRQWIPENPKLKGYWMLATPDVKDKCLPQLNWEPLYTAPPTSLVGSECGLVGKQEPVGEVKIFITPNGNTATDFEVCLPVGTYKLYTAPPQREWVEPSDEQALEAMMTYYGGGLSSVTSRDLKVARAVLKLAKELNT